MKAIVPPRWAPSASAARMSPAILADNFVFVTGTTGSDPSGAMPTDEETQFRNTFAKVGDVLAEAGLSLRSVVEMTTYHVGLRAHFDLFDAVRLEHFGEPYPAWTAVEVAGLRREGACIEIRVIASVGA